MVDELECDVRVVVEDAFGAGGPGDDGEQDDAEPVDEAGLEDTARAVHTNLLVCWLLLGFMGAAYFIIPEEADCELWSPKLAYFQLIAFLAVGVTAIVCYHLNIWEGRKFLEIPRPLDYLVVFDVLLFLLNIGMTVLRGKRHTTTALVLYM